MKARLKKELGQTGGLVSVFGEMFVAQERHRGLVGSAQAWMQGMPELSFEIWQQGLVALWPLGPRLPRTGQKSSIQLILQQILKTSFNGLGQERDSTANLPSGSPLAHCSCSERALSVGMSLLAGDCQEVFGGSQPWVQQPVLRGGNTQESQGSQEHPACSSLWLSWLQQQPGFTRGPEDAGEGRRGT